MRGFPNAIEDIMKHDILFVKIDDFQYEVASYAKDIFVDHPVQKDSLRYAGQIHVTHTFPLSQVGICDHDLIRSTNTKSSRTSFEEELTTTKLSTATRGSYTPSPKCPIEVLSKNHNNDYITAVMKGLALYPMSNIVEYIRSDLKLYEQVLHRLIDNAKIPKITRTKLENTINLLKKQIGEIGVRSENDLVFWSYEEKLQPLVGNLEYFLVEHRTGILVEYCNNAIKHQKYNESEYNKICTILQKIDIKDPSLGTLQHHKKECIDIKEMEIKFKIYEEKKQNEEIEAIGKSWESKNVPVDEFVREIINELLETVTIYEITLRGLTAYSEEEYIDK